jgi:hypothetical protein
MAPAGTRIIGWWVTPGIPRWVQRAPARYTVGVRRGVTDGTPRRCATTLRVASPSTARSHPVARGYAAPQRQAAPQADPADTPSGGAPATTAPALKPRIFGFGSEPVFPQADGFWQLPPGAGEAILVTDAEHATTVEFLLSPTGTGGDGLAVRIGQDTNGRDGYLVRWHYADQALLAHLTVRATGPGGITQKVVDVHHADPAHAALSSGDGAEGIRPVPPQVPGGRGPRYPTGLLEEVAWTRTAALSRSRQRTSTCLAVAAGRSVLPVRAPRRDRWPDAVGRCRLAARGPRRQGGGCTIRSVVRHYALCGR